MMATMTQIANLLSGFQKQFPPTNNQLRSSSNSRTHAMVHDGQIVTKTVQRRAPGNVGNTGSRGNQSYGNMTTATGKKVICYNCRGEGHVARQCKEPKRAKDSQYFKDKMLLMESKPYFCSIVLYSDVVVTPSSNCSCDNLRLECDREHNKVLALEAEISKQKRLITESEKRFAFLEQNYLRDQLQGKDATIRNLVAQINIMKVLNVGSTELDGLKVENVSLKRRYDELSKANTHSRTAYTEKLSALTAEHTKLQAQVTGKTSSGPSTSETPKVLAPGMYNLGSKYIPPPKRANWVKSTQLPKTKQVTFIEPPRPSLKPTQKPVVHHNKQTNVCVPMSTGVKPTSGASKPVPKRAPRNHSSLPAKSANARRVEAHHRTLNKKNRVDSNLLVKHSVFVSNSNNDCGARNKSLVFSNHNACLVMCDDSVNDKPHPTKRSTRQPMKEWKPINKVRKPIKRVWNHISKNVANTKPQWKPTGSYYSLIFVHISSPII
ncbi:putative reverse transcriptase domain, ribonuclease H-like domain, aspartic peptidase domain protein [Tanacetum coccineum]